MITTFRAHIEAHVSLSDNEFELVSSRLVPKSYRKHQFMVQRGDPVLNDHWLVKGLAKAYFLDENGKEHVLQFAIEDWWITDYQAYFNRSPAQIWVECLEPTQVLCLSETDRNDLSNRIHAMANFFRIKGNRGYVALQQRIMSLLHAPAQERYQEFLDKYPKLVQRMSKTHLAAYLGVSRETLSRLSKT